MNNFNHQFLRGLLVLALFAPLILTAQSWSPVGQALFSPDSLSESIDLEVDGSDLYVSYAFNNNAEGRGARVMKYNGSSWSVLGGKINVPNFQDVEPISIAVYAGTPYIAFMDASESNKVTVQRWQSNSWQTVGVAGFSHAMGFYPKIAFIGSEPHVLYVAGSQLSMQKFNGVNWVYVGARDFAYVSKARLAVENSTIYVSGVDAGTPKCYKFDGSSWAQVGGSIGGTISTSAQGLAVAAGIPYVAYVNNSGGKASVREYNGTTWAVVGGFSQLDFTPGDARHLSLAMQGSTPYVAFRDLDLTIPKISVMRHQSGGWAYVGFPGITQGNADWPDLEIIGTDVYVAFKDNTDWGKVTVYKADVPVGNDFPIAENRPTVYPNPSAGSFHISFPTLPEAASLVVYNAMGQEVLLKQLTTTRSAIDLGQAPAGIYLLEVQSNGQRIDTQKLIVR